MPRGDRSGPEGAGPLTGIKTGYCTGNIRAGWKTPGLGRSGRGWGFHRFPHDYQSDKPPQPDISRNALQSEREVLRSQLEEIEHQLSAIDAKEKK